MTKLFWLVGGGLCPLHVQTCKNLIAQRLEESSGDRDDHVDIREFGQQGIIMQNMATYVTG